MKTILYFFSIFFVIFAAENVFSQPQNDSTQFLYGKIIENETNEKVIFAHIVNISQKLATISDTSGNFRVTAKPNDSLKITAIGFFTEIVVAPNPLKRINVKLKRKIYSLGVVDIYKIRMESLKFDVLHSTKTAVTKEQQHLTEYFDRTFDKEELKLLYRTKGWGIPLNFQTWQDESRAKLKIIEQRERIEEIIYTKYNDSIIHRITGLSGNDILEFRQFCHFKKSYLLEAAPLEIFYQIKRMYDLYRKELDR